MARGLFRINSGRCSLEKWPQGLNLTRTPIYILSLHPSVEWQTLPFQGGFHVA